MSGPTELSLAPDEAFSALQAKRLKSLDDGALAAPSQVRVVITYRSNSESSPILCDRPVPDVPAGPILPLELGGPLRRIWGAIDSDLVAWGGGGAGLTVARLGRGPSWPCTEHERAKCRHGRTCPWSQPSMRFELFWSY